MEEELTSKKEFVENEIIDEMQSFIVNDDEEIEIEKES